MSWTVQQLSTDVLSNLQHVTRDDPQHGGYRWNALRDRAKHRPEITQDEMKRHLEAIAEYLDQRDPKSTYAKVRSAEDARELAELTRRLKVTP